MLPEPHLTLHDLSPCPVIHMMMPLMQDCNPYRWLNPVVESMYQIVTCPKEAVPAQTQHRKCQPCMPPNVSPSGIQQELTMWLKQAHLNHSWSVKQSERRVIGKHERVRREIWPGSALACSALPVSSHVFLKAPHWMCSKHQPVMKTERARIKQARRTEDK